MNRYDLAGGLFWLGISIFVSFKATQLGVGAFSNPGPGFVLFWSSLIFGTLSIGLVIKAILRKGGQRILADSWRGLKWSHVLITTIALFLYASFLTQIGFLLMTFCFMMLLYGPGNRSPGLRLPAHLSPSCWLTSSFILRCRSSFREEYLAGS